MIKTSLGAKRYNNMLDRIFENAKRLERGEQCHHIFRIRTTTRYKHCLKCGYIKKDNN